MSEQPAARPSLLQGSRLVRDDWADDLPLTDHNRFFVSRDWANSRLGVLANWPPALRLHVFTVLADARPSCIYWGPDRVAIYNAAFRPLSGSAHPKLMGNTLADGFPRVWNNIRKIFDAGEQTGVTTDAYDIELFIERDGYLEETYFTGNFTPLRGDSGRVEGFYNTVHEVTRQAINDRRTAMLNLMAQPLADSEVGYSHHIMAAFRSNPRDVPMALLYHLDEDETSCRNIVRLLGSIGVPADHKLAVSVSDINGSDGFIPHFQKAKRAITRIDVNEDFAGINWEGFGEPSKVVHILPLAGGGRLVGFLVIGSNPRRAIDSYYLQYLQDLSRQLSSTMIAAINIVEAKKREERLERDLAQSERRIRYFAKYSMVGMVHSRMDGLTLWANEQYYKLVGRSPSEESHRKLLFLEIVHEDDRPRGQEAFDRLAHGEKFIELDLRLQKTFQPPFGEPEPACVLVYAFPYSEIGQLESIMTCITDVSRLKWAESWQARKAKNAREAKRRQEEFVDIISHEIRNPLSAILQCADMISKSQMRFLEHGMSHDSFLEILANNAEDAETIIMCAKHQKRMVDDILTLSKLDFTGLSISTAGIQVSALVEGTVKMFEVELNSNGIEHQVIAEPAMSQLGIDWIMCDPSRITQVLVNLLTNAIKFTRIENTRKIQISYGASLSNPRAAFPEGIHWAPAHEETDDLTRDWNTDDQFYLTVTVSDTGAGMTFDEIQRIFSRFKQGNSKTSIKYGGSGLGLYISRQLTTKHGGDIGVTSVPGTGSIFGFYIKARRIVIAKAIAPPVSAPQQTSLQLRSQEYAKAEHDARLSGRSILLVEDNIVNQKVLRKQLVSTGCLVFVANHGLEALEFLRTTTAWHNPLPEAHPLDVVLMDVEMPVMNGLACSQELRALEATGQVTKHVQIIGITANARQEQIDVAMEAGMDEVITKPFVIADLLARIKGRLRAEVAINGPGPVGSGHGNPDDDNMNGDVSAGGGVEPGAGDKPGDEAGNASTDAAGESTNEAPGDANDPSASNEPGDTKSELTSSALEDIKDEPPSYATGHIRQQSACNALSYSKDESASIAPGHRRSESAGPSPYTTKDQWASNSPDAPEDSSSRESTSNVSGNTNGDIASIGMDNIVGALANDADLTRAANVMAVSAVVTAAEVAVGSAAAGNVCRETIDNATTVSDISVGSSAVAAPTKVAASG